MPRKTCKFFFNNIVHRFHRRHLHVTLIALPARMPDAIALLGSTVSKTSNGVLAIPARVIATSFALACFAATVCFGLYNGNGFSSILVGAFASALIAYIIGSIVGAVALRSVNEQIERHKADNPIPTDEPSSAADPAGETAQAALG